MKEIASGLEIDQAQLERDLQSDQGSEHIAADRAEAEQFGFDGTPAFVINGMSLIGNHPKRDFDRIIKRMLQETEAMVR